MPIDAGGVAWLAGCNENKEMADVVRPELMKVKEECGDGCRQLL